MSVATQRATSSGLASLRRFVQQVSRAEELCELCAAPVTERHPHLFDARNRRILCTCDACAILFSGSVKTQYRRVSRDVQYLADFHLDDALWNSLMIPIGLVFFSISSVSGETAAFYPSRAGATESTVDPELWTELLDRNPVLQNMRPDIEALLVNRFNQEREYYLAPIDDCYRLTGLIRKHWTGFSGGSEVWQVIRDYFAGLRQRSCPTSVENAARY